MGVPRALGFAAPFAAVLLIGCDKPDNSEIVREGRQLAAISTLEVRVDILEKFKSDTEYANADSAILKLSDKGYDELQTNIGPITIQLLSVKAQGSGSILAVKIGNTTHATFETLKISGHWFAVDKDANPAGKGHDFTANINGPIYAGSWNTTRFMIEGAKPADIGFVSIHTADVSRLSLNPR